MTHESLSLFHPDCPFQLRAHVDGLCDACGGKLTGRQRRWCGKDCELRWWRNHSWSFARNAAIRRDKRTCQRCNVTEDQLFYTRAAKLEVNHKVPCLGKHAVKGCHNHLENLETLCHACHVIVTAEQRSQGHFAKGAVA